MNTKTNTPPLIVGRAEVEKLTSLHKSSIYRLLKIGSFPKPLRIAGTNRVAWRLKDIEAWIDSLETDNTDEVLVA